MIRTYSTELGNTPTEEEIKEAEDVINYPIVFDEDCPELSPAMMKAFRNAVVQRNRRKKA
ncbi:MAG: hypothetical protein LUI87_11725 [Lachnospiraceae bacterium]|nr:hypothetical protein [Lachnospiraceae bacterium]